MHNQPLHRVLGIALFALLPITARAQTPPDHSQEAVVVEQLRTAWRFESDGTGRREIYTRVRTQSDAGVQQWGQLLFGYNAANERAEIEFVRVRKPDGSVVNTSLDSVQDLSAPVQRIAPIYTDFRQKHVTVESLRPGDTLEFKMISTVHTALAPGHFWTEHNFDEEAIVLDELLEIDVPAEKPLTLKSRAGYDPEITEKAGRRIHRWTRANLARKTEDEEKDDQKSEKGAREESERSAVRLTTFQNWEQVGRWYAALEAPQRMPTADIRNKAAELTRGLRSDLEKLEALYTFVATNFRYVSLSLGMGRYQPRAAADVLREQYGDCKDKHTLLASLIDAAGLRASAVLINTRTRIDPAFPSPSQFDHVITLASAAGEDVWVDTTTEVAPFRLLLLPLRKKQALLIDVAGTPRLVETPANPPMKSFASLDVDTKLGESGTLDAHVTFACRGDIELMMRMAFRNTPAADWKHILESAFGTAGKQTGKVSNWKVSDPAALKDPFRLEVDVSFATFVNWSGGKASVPLLFTDAVSPPTDNDAADDEPIALGAAPHEMSYKLRLHVPRDVTVRAPLPVSIARDYAEYRASYTVTGSTFSAERIFLVRQSELPIERKEDHAALVRVLAADSRQQLALTTTSTTASNAGGDMTTSELNQRGYAALQARNYDEAVSLLKRVVELEPKHKTAWNNLGRAHMALRQHDQAIAAFRKQTEINPYDEYAHNLLGHAFSSLHRFEEAEAAFKRQIEINPLDRYAAASLGSVYLERRQYDAALVHFEKAITLNPDDSWLQVQLGKTHLSLNHEREALTAFDRAVELAPTPTTWNNVAYELALKSVHLDRALQYAESAVSSLTAASRNLDLTRADDKSLGIVQSLGAYWDTLGWVHFARGDLTRAERLVEASWRLGQSAEVGDHLAQIYEKTGRRDEAISTYAMALASERPSVDTRARLARMLGDPAKVDGTVNMHREALAKARTVRIADRGARGATADFVVLFSSTGGAEGVRFVSGNEALRPLAGAIQKATYARMFPDEAPAKLLRRGMLGCPPLEGDCTFTLLLPRDTESVR